ncbi:Nif3-like dinuclear metal center hexameric protein [Mycoplasma sp. 480]|uniref:Nif3-like dinuclear metal center hexameric protein n=1 Tax=Mycoplasma sp. 480 TaxID=3440155 RepID=UPI003F513FF7
MNNSKEFSLFLDSIFPQNSKEDWDKVGFSYFFDNQISKVLICLDLTKKALDYAIKNNFNFILTYHTFLFYKGYLKNTFEKEPYKKSMHKLIKKYKINVFSIHTNLDFLPNSGVKSILEKINLEGDLTPVNKFNSIVNLKSEISFFELINKIKNMLNLNNLQTNLQKNKKIKKIVILPGAAGIENILETYKVIKNKALYITSDLKWNELLTINNLKIDLLVVPHSIEKANIDFMYKIIKKSLTNLKVEKYLENEFIINI